MERTSLPLRNLALGLESENGAQVTHVVLVIHYGCPSRGILTTGHVPEGLPATALLSAAFGCPQEVSGGQTVCSDLLVTVSLLRSGRTAVCAHCVEGPCREQTMTGEFSGKFVMPRPSSEAHAVLRGQ